MFSFIVSSFYYINRVQAAIVLPDLNVALLERKIQQVCVSPAGYVSLRTPWPRTLRLVLTIYLYATVLLTLEIAGLH